ncbi:MAG: hypothetical protein NC205_00015 [Prevotella sp.]|nr:hypothetical protein [Alistipes senegalensis]MCM1356948.1 hypothetical protein [Prevotella sp.]MDE5556589.1 hypothetical protein [Ruminococcus sp.]MDE6427040.1 hypothetical protein [Ruminococcus sp.]MDE6539502.1 hypothetical protein [Ruminococcus sp.]
MSDKLFKKILITVLIIGAVSTAVLVGYTFYLHEHCSIISYIANGG